MASAHWISLPWDLQPGASRQARHRVPTVIATPKLELASEYALCSTRGWGLGIGMAMLARWSWSCHQAKSSGVSLSRGCVWKERTIVEGGEHGLHAGEVSASRWDNQCCVQ